MSAAMQVLVAGLEWLGFLVAALVVCLAIWYGVRVEIGKPGDNGHITLEVYAAKRLFTNQPPPTP